jgi:hypothetical protein
MHATPRRSIRTVASRPTPRIRSGFDRGRRSAPKAVAVGDWQKARAIADRAILVEQMGLSEVEALAIRNGHDALLATRFSLAARATKRAV